MCEAPKTPLAEHNPAAARRRRRLRLCAAAVVCWILVCGGLVGGVLAWLVAANSAGAGMDASALDLEAASPSLPPPRAPPPLPPPPQFPPAIPVGDPQLPPPPPGAPPSPPRPSPPPSAPTVFVTLQLTVDNVYSTAGHVLVWVHTSSSTWPDKGGAYYFERLTVPSSKEVSLAVEVPAGEIAVMSYHDKNDNLKMDTNWIGYPEEGAAASNGARGGPLGGPKWSDAKVAVAAGAPVSLELSMWNP